jgi:ribosome maturation protein Sdo1
MPNDFDHALDGLSDQLRQKPPSPEMQRADNEIVRHIKELGEIHSETAKLVIRMNQTFSQKVGELSDKLGEFERRLAQSGK